MFSLLRTTLLEHAQRGNNITEPALLGLLAITGGLVERLTTLETTIQPSPISQASPLGDRIFPLDARPREAAA